MARTVLNWVLGLAGAALGGVLGHLLFMWILRQGFYALIIPGAALGLGCGLLSEDRSNARGLVCGLAAVALGLFSEWSSNVEQLSVREFLSTLPPIALILIGIGAFIAFWWGRDNIPGIRREAIPRYGSQHGRDEPQPTDK